MSARRRSRAGAWPAVLLLCALLRPAGGQAQESEPAAGQAQEPELVSDRPDFTESAATVPPGRPQLEAGYTFSRYGIGLEHALGEILLRLPVLRRLELRLEANSLVHQEDLPDATGLENPAVGAKLALLGPSAGREAAPVSLAILASSSVPIGSDAVAADAAEPEVRLAVSGDLGRDSGWAANLGWAYPVEDRRLHQLLGSLAFGTTLGARVDGYVEAYGWHHPDLEEAATEAYLNGGITWLLTPHFQADARLGTGLTKVAADLFVGIGMAYRW
ncbi:MAG: transporter [Longimicrobiales bacterium]